MNLLTLETCLNLLKHVLSDLDRTCLILSSHTITYIQRHPKKNRLIFVIEKLYCTILTWHAGPAVCHWDRQTCWPCCCGSGSPSCHIIVAVFLSCLAVANNSDSSHSLPANRLAWLIPKYRYSVPPNCCVFVFLLRHAARMIHVSGIRTTVAKRYGTLVEGVDVRVRTQPGWRLRHNCQAATAESPPVPLQILVAMPARDGTLAIEAIESDRNMIFINQTNRNNLTET